MLKTVTNVACLKPGACAYFQLLQRINQADELLLILRSFPNEYRASVIATTVMWIDCTPQNNYS
jgi:hypothetical protein